MTRERKIYNVTLIGSLGNVLLMAFKFVAGIIGHSSAMIADAIHSLSDFLTDVVVLVFVRISAKPQDESHDYGHGKFEAIASFLIGLALVCVAGGIIYAGGEKFVSWMKGVQLEAPTMLALWAALVSIGVKELLYHYTAHWGKKLESSVMVSNAWHHRSDSLSSIGSALGIGGAILLGDRWTVLDPLASIAVGLMLINIAIKLLKSNIGELTDSSLPAETENDIIRIIESFPDVREPHNLRTRRIGNRIAIEVHVVMDGEKSLNETHDRATAIEKKLREEFGKQTHVTVHMEPYRTKE